MDYKLFLPGFISGFSELLIFHPFDTIGKRIMNEGKIQVLKIYIRCWICWIIQNTSKNF